MVRAKVSRCNRRPINFRIKNAVSRLTGYWPINLHYSSALCFDWLRTWECVSHGGTLCTGPLSSCQKLGPLGHRIHQMLGRRGCTVHYSTVLHCTVYSPDARLTVSLSHIVRYQSSSDCASWTLCINASKACSTVWRHQALAHAPLLGPAHTMVSGSNRIMHTLYDNKVRTDRCDPVFSCQ